MYLYSEIFDFDEPTLAPQPRSIPATRPTPSAATPLRPAPPPPTRTRAQPLPAASTGSVEVKCRCNVPAGERTVVKEGPNKGRRFWTCSNSGQCDFFEWMDGPSSGSSLLRDASLNTAPKKMPIGRAVRILLSNTGFQLTDNQQYSDSSAMHNDTHDVRRCKCDMTAVQKTVVKEGPNQGRKFWICPNCEKARCGYFEWDDDPASTAAGSPAVNSKAHTAGSSQQGGCYKVNMTFSAVRPYCIN